MRVVLDMVRNFEASESRVPHTRFERVQVMNSSRSSAAGDGFAATVTTIFLSIASGASPQGKEQGA